MNELSFASSEWAHFTDREDFFKRASALSQSPNLSFTSLLEKITYLLSGNLPFLYKLGKELILYLESLEKVPVRFGSNQTINFKKIVEITEIVLIKLPIDNANSLKIKQDLQRHSIALKYRLEKVNGGEDKLQNYDKDLFADLCAKALEWKAFQDTMKNKDLSITDLQALQIAAQFDAFGHFILKNALQADVFFLYALRDKCPVDFFIQFPAMVHKLSESGMLGRIGRLKENSLKIAFEILQDGGYEKIAVLPFEGRLINILDGKKEVTFRGNYTLTIDEIFTVFKNKVFGVGNLEFMADGIINWNTHKLGWWNADKQEYEVIALHKKEWWKSLPFFEVITKEVAQQRYGGHLDGYTWNAAATSTRGSATMDYDKSHSYLELAIPCKGNKHYAIYDFGKFALRFPANFFEGLQIFCHTLIATVAYPDENVFYSQREHAQHSFALKAKEGSKILEAIRLDLIKARAGNFVYQIETENCAKWLHEKLEVVHGSFYNLFKMPLLQTTPFGVVYVIFSLICMLPKSIQVRVLTACHIPLGALHSQWIFENHEWKCLSMSTHSFFQTGEVYLPAFLHLQLEKGVLEKTSLLHVAKKSLTMSKFFYLSLESKVQGQKRSFKGIKGFYGFQIFENTASLFKIFSKRFKNIFIVVSGFGKKMFVY